MPDATAPLTFDALDEVLVKEPDGTFHVVKVAPGKSAGKDTTFGVSATPSVHAPLPRVLKPAPLPMVLGAEETKELAIIVEKTKTIAPKTDDTSVALARRAIAMSGIVLADPSLANRLFTVLVAFVKEVRKELETRDVLMRPKERGGLGMTIGDATRLLSFLQPHTTLGVGAIPRVNAQPPPPPSPVVSKPVTPPPPRPTFVSQNLGGQAPITNPRTTFGVAPTPSVNESKGQTPPPSKSVFPPPQQVTRPPVETKPIVQDVTFTPKLIGPVEELRMALVDWRRMAPTVKDRATRIAEKLRLLEEESYGERVKGVSAWYGGDIVRLYQDIGRESLVSGKPVVTILQERQIAGKPSLSEEEFLSLVELNEKIRF